jgi:TM2 domain-containing membrane protein YozV
MKRNPFLAGVLSLLVPGLGQIYAGQGNKGAAVIFAAIVIGNLNILILPLISMANPVIPPSTSDLISLWTYWIPRIVHDIVSFWSVVFWIWAVVDAFALARTGA